MYSDDPTPRFEVSGYLFLALLAALAVGVAFLPGCGMYGSKPMATEGAHWRPASPITADQQAWLDLAATGTCETAKGGVTRLGMNGTGTTADKDYSDTFTAIMLPNGQVVTPAWVGNTSWHYRQVTCGGHWLILNDVADAYDAKRKLALFSVMRARGVK